MALNNLKTNTNDEYDVYYDGAFIYDEVDYSDLDYDCRYSDWYKNKPTDKC